MRCVGKAQLVRRTTLQHLHGGENKMSEKIETRVWEGLEEFGECPYYVGQIKICSGRLAGCYKSVTNRYSTRKEAQKALNEFIEADEV